MRLAVALCALVILCAFITAQTINIGSEEARPFIKFAPENTQQARQIRFYRNVKSTVSGFHPADIKSYYGFSESTTAGAGQTVAIVAAYDNPNVEADLGVFSTEFGLPSCTTANGCFKKVNYKGGSTFTSPQSPWTSEICLDVQWVHAMAPGAKIVLVLANSASLDDLMTAVLYAKSISNILSLSWGTNELSGHSTTYDQYFSQTGLTTYVASGDTGAIVTYPAASKNVIGVGGTTLSVSTKGAFESGWSGTGGGCSLYSTATTYQQKFTSTMCGTKRGVPDIALLGDPLTGVSIYDSYGCTASICWKVAGGTSLATPILAATAAVSNLVVTSSMVYTNSSSTLSFRDILIGKSSNTQYAQTYSCQAGYDLVTGMGSWYSSSSVIVAATNSAPTVQMGYIAIILAVIALIL